MEATAQCPRAVPDLEPQPSAVLEAACCNQIVAQLGELAALTNKASKVFTRLDEQVILLVHH